MLHLQEPVWHYNTFVFYFSLDTSFLNLFIAFLSSVVVFSIDKHFGEYTLGEIPFDKVF